MPIGIPMRAAPDEQMERAILGVENALVTAAQARAEAERLDEMRKQTRAAMIVHYREDGKGVAEASEYAMASQPYKDAAAAWIVANYAYRETDARAEAKRLKFEAWRTEQATERAKVNLR